MGQPPAAPVATNAAELDPHLAWQSSIGQLIFLQSVLNEPI